MREKAISLRSDATVLEASFDNLPARADVVEFRAHAGDRWRRNIRHAVRSAYHYAADARHLARRLDQAADALEEDLHAWGRAQERYATERREAATKPNPTS
jgi:hypothetical protein